MDNLKISIVQSALIWENKQANLDAFSTKINQIETETDVIVLPEMFTTGFSMKPQKLAEATEDQTYAWMKKQALAKQAAIVGSFIVVEKGKYYNRLLWVNPDEIYEKYDKRHLFSLAKEHLHYTAGNEKIIINYKGWRIRPLICYDLRFPVWARNVNDYDLLLYVANWPTPRAHAWRTLLQARAIENQAYVAGVNRVGEDAFGNSHSGDSAVINPLGELLTSIKPFEEATETIELSVEMMGTFRQKFPFGNDADSFEV